MSLGSFCSGLKSTSPNEKTNLKSTTTNTHTYTSLVQDNPPLLHNNNNSNTSTNSRYGGNDKYWSINLFRCFYDPLCCLYATTGICVPCIYGTAMTKQDPTRVFCVECICSI